MTDVMKLMTMRRLRHVPVKDGDQLVGIISIGDVLKHRLGELEVEADVLGIMRLRFLASVAVLQPIMAAPMIASSDALQDCKCV